jgi:CRP-like cAMP-binding protein
VGEIWLLTQTPRAATATATTRVEVAVIPYCDMVELIRRRPDIAVIIYRSLALGLGHKLRQAGDAGRMIASVEPADA